MSRKNTARAAARPAPTARKKAVTSRRTAEAVEAAPALVEALPTTPAEVAAPVVAEPVVAIAEPAPVAEPTPPAEPAVAQKPVTVTRGEFEAAVRREAWLLAEARSFRNGSAFEDWIRAEGAVRARLAADGISVR